MASKNKIIKIAVTGPESSGKSFTSEYLARYFDGWVVPEFGREYLDQLDRDYNYQDILNIAKAQKDIEQKVTTDAINEEVDIIFFDTELINTMIWSEEKYQKVDNLIQQGIIASEHDHYLLMKPDIAWEPDPLRENPNDRDRLFQLHIDRLEEYKKSYTIIQGDLQQRLKQAIGVINTFKL